MDRKTQVDLSPYIVNVQGKDFITFPGLLAEAHAQGLVAIETNLVNTDMANPVVKATVHIRSDEKTIKLFNGYGDANANNVAKKVAGALLRMAETRAIARALRFACNIDMTALEEIGVEDDAVSSKPVVAKTVSAPKLSIPGPIKAEKKEEVVEQTQVQTNKETSSTTQNKLTFNRRPKAEPNFP